MSSQLLLHCGARQVEISDLAKIETPRPVGRWFPIPHIDVLEKVKETLMVAGFAIQRERHSLSHGDARYFAILDLADYLHEGVSLTVGIRNSFDKSFPIGFCAGNRVFVCDNLCFSSELMVSRKHTRFGRERFAADINQAIEGLSSFKQLEAKRIEAMVNTPVSTDEANSLILQAYENRIIPARRLNEVIRDWRDPKHDEFKHRSYWSLLNAFTYGMKQCEQSDPQLYSAMTMRFMALLLSSRLMDVLSPNPVLYDGNGKYIAMGGPFID
jgi:hypothetical protein